MLKYKNTRTFKTVKYNQWINDIVLKGNAYKYEVFKTWDLVVVRKKTNGVFKNLEITEIENAKNLRKQFPLEYDYVGTDIDAQIKIDIAKSNKIKRWRFFFNIRRAITAIISPIKIPIKNISLAEWILIAFGLLTILIMLNKIT